MSINDVNKGSMLVGLKEYTIKLATTEDTSVVLTMIKQVAQWLKDKDINQWRFTLEGGDDEEIAQAIVNKETYLVLKDNDIVATFTLSTKQTKWDLHIWGEDMKLEALYLHKFAILPSNMKSGLGQTILNWIQENVTDKEILKLDCVADNLKLNEFYQRNGFELVGVTDAHSKYQKIIKNSTILN